MEAQREVRKYLRITKYELPKLKGKESHKIKDQQQNQQNGQTAKEGKRYQPRFGIDKTVDRAYTLPILETLVEPFDHLIKTDFITPNV